MEDDAARLQKNLEKRIVSMLEGLKAQVMEEFKAVIEELKAKVQKCEELCERCAKDMDALRAEVKTVSKEVRSMQKQQTRNTASIQQIREDITGVNKTIKDMKQSILEVTAYAVRAPCCVLCCV